MATVSKWTPFGVALDITATGSSVTRTSATKFTVKISASWETYYSGAQTNYGMTATSGGKSVTINTFGVKASKGSGSFTGTYAISGNGSATKTITVTFKNFNNDNGDSASKSVTFNVTVPAWTSYTVSYNANGGTGAPGSQTKWKDQTLTLSTTKPTRSGYTFVGWGLSTTDTSADYQAGGKYTANASDTLYAIWKKTISLSYSLNGGSGTISSQSATVYNATTNKTFTISSTKPTRTGYTFKGWNISGSSTLYSPGSSITISSNTTLSANWSLNVYAISWNGNGNGDNVVYSPTPTSTAQHGQTITLPTAYRTGYAFLGWATSSTATAPTHSAGASYTVTKSVTFYAFWEVAYTKPIINNLSVSRTQDEKNIRVQFTWNTYYSNPTITVSCTSGSNTLSQGFNSSGTAGSIDTTIGDDSLDIETTYTVRVVVYDSGGVGYKTITVTGTSFVMDALAGGKGVSFGKAADMEGYADFAFSTRHRKSMHFDNHKMIYGTEPDGSETAVIIPKTSSGNTAIGYGNYANKSGITGIYGNDIMFYVGSTDTGGDLPYFRKGMAMTLTLRTAGFVTNSGKDIYFTVPLAKPIYGSPTVSVASGNGFTLRQGGKYTHGSTDTVYTVPTSYTASVSHTSFGIYIKASFTDTTNVINNDAIGIYWHGTITFS